MVNGFDSCNICYFFMIRELIDVVNNCRDIPDKNVIYYTPVYIPVNQYVTVSHPYKINSGGIYPKRIKERYYHVQY